MINDLNKTNEYLLSISSEIIELYNLKTEEYSLLEAKNFFEHTEGTYSYDFQILEAKYNNMNIYFCIYSTLELNETGNYTENYIEIKRFGLINFNLEFDLVKKIQFRCNEITSISSSFIWNYYNLLAIFYLPYNETKYHLRLYDYDLNQVYDNSFSYSITSGSSIEKGMFFKSCHLEDEYAAFFYFAEGGKRYSFEILYLNKTSDTSYSLDKTQDLYGMNSPLITDIAFNDFVKLADHRLALISTGNSTTIYIILFELVNIFEGIAARYYRFSLNNQIISGIGNEIVGFAYNQNLCFTTTVKPTFPNNEQDNAFPIFLMFGFPNGTDSEIDIYPFLMDSDDYNETNNFFDYLIENMTIENNIFGYIPHSEITFSSIPNELAFLNTQTGGTTRSKGLLNKYYGLIQNDSIIKDDKYYYLEYQYIVSEPYYLEDSYYDNYVVDFLNYGDAHIYYNKVPLF